MHSRRVSHRRWIAAAGAGSLVWAAWVHRGFAHPSPTHDDGETGTILTHRHPHEAATPEEAARRAEVVVKFRSGQLTVGQLEDAILDKNPYMQQRYLTLDAVRNLLDRSLRFELLAAEAEKRGYDKHAAVMSEVKQNLVQKLIREDFDSKITPDSVPDEEVKRYYAAHESEFVRPETRRASVMLLGSESEAQGVLAQARAADLRAFRELARSRGGDASRNDQRASDARFFDAEGQLVEGSDPGPKLDPILVKAVFALKNLGDTTGVLETEDGFVIAKLAGQRPAQTETLKQVDQRVRFRLWRERREAAIDAKLSELRKETQVEVHPELIDAVKLDSAPLPPGKGLPAGFPHTRPAALMRPAKDQH